MTTSTSVGVAVGIGLLAALGCGACTQRPVALTGSLHGTLTTPRGTPLVGGTIRLSGAIEAAVQSDAEGAFLFERVPAGPYLVAATADHTLEGVTTRLVQVSGADDGAIALALTGVGTVRGKITLEDEPLAAGTQVVIGGRTQITLTGLDGSFVIDRVPEGKASLFAIHEGWQPSTLGAVEIQRGDDRAFEELQLKKTSILTTSLTGHTTVPGATDHSGVLVTIAGTKTSTLSQADGSFVLDTVPIGIVTLELRRGSYTSVVPSIYVTSTAPPIVMAREPYVLPTIDLVFGEHVGTPTDGGGTPTADNEWLITSTRLNTADSRVVATQRTTGVKHTLDHATLMRLHPDGKHVLALQYTNLPGIEQSLVSWDPASGAVAVLEPDVDYAEYLPSRNEVFVRRPMLKLVSLSGGATRTIGEPADVAATATFDTFGKTILLNASYADAKWIDLDSNTTLFSVSNTSGVTLSPSGEGLLLVDKDLLRYRSRAGVMTTISSLFYGGLAISPDGRVVSYYGDSKWHLYDLQALSEIVSYETSTQAGYAFSPDSKSFIGVRNATAGTEVVIFDLPSGTSHAPITFDRMIYPSWFQYVGRYAYVSLDNGDSTSRLEQVDLAQATKRVFVDHMVQVSALRPEAIFYVVRENGAVIGKRLAVDVANATPVSFPGYPLTISDSGTRVIGMAGDDFIYTNLTTGKQVVLAVGHSDSVNDITGSFLDETHIQLRRYVQDYYAQVAPAIQVGEGLYVGAPDEVQP